MHYRLNDLSFPVENTLEITFAYITLQYVYTENCICDMVMKLYA